mmetsp:Transcript_14415/g.25360  ORF Transcript_14415/g.25360 Transcript_14415/m.25360 type:complete len:123 (+) Transcript_14415:701-1069(+)
MMLPLACHRYAKMASDVAKSCITLSITLAGAIWVLNAEPKCMNMARSKDVQSSAHRVFAVLQVVLLLQVYMLGGPGDYHACCHGCPLTETAASHVKYQRGQASKWQAVSQHRKELQVRSVFQ